WNEFDALGPVPVMVIRGANSDILSAATVEGMRKRRRALEVLEVPQEGHAPRLAGALTIDRVAGFIASCDPTEPRYPSYIQARRPSRFISWQNHFATRPALCIFWRGRSRRSPGVPRAR